MMKYAVYVTTSQSEDEGQVNTQIDVGIDIHTNLIGQTSRSTVIDTTHPIGLVFSQIIIQSDF